jgi:hypothetical protein
MSSNRHFPAEMPATAFLHESHGVRDRAAAFIFLGLPERTRFGQDNFLGLSERDPCCIIRHMQCKTAV